MILIINPEKLSVTKAERKVLMKYLKEYISQISVDLNNSNEAKP